MDEPEIGNYVDRACAYARELRQEADAIERCPELLRAASLGDDLFDDTVQFLLQLDDWSGDLTEVAYEFDGLE
ncbi:MAG TPA: hypothetical protein VF060_19560 [Trebonia sp.]